MPSPIPSESSQHLDTEKQESTLQHSQNSHLISLFSFYTLLWDTVHSQIQIITYTQQTLSETLNRILSLTIQSISVIIHTSEHLVWQSFGHSAFQQEDGYSCLSNPSATNHTL